MDEKDFLKFIYQPEGPTLDFKLQQYKLEIDHLKSEFIKDILSMSNTIRNCTSYIVLGVKAYPDGKRDLEGVSFHWDDADLQSIIKDKVEKVPPFQYFPITIHDKTYGIIEIPVSYDKPFRVSRDFGVIKKHAVYIRRGSMNDDARDDEIGAMYLEPKSTKNAWIPDTVSQQGTSKDLLDATYPTEAVIWKYQSGLTNLVNNNFRSTNLSGELLLVGLNDNVVGLDVNSGQCKWKCKINTFASAPDRFENMIIVPGCNTIYAWEATLSNKWYHNFNAIWNFEHGSNYPRLKVDSEVGYVSTLRRTAKPQGPNNVLYGLHGIAGINLKSGELIWRFDTSEEGISNIKVLNEVVYFATDRSVYALEKRNGSIMWQANTGTAHSGNVFPLDLNDEFLVVGSWDPVNGEYYQVHCFDSITGTKHWENELYSKDCTCMVSTISMCRNITLLGKWDGEIVAMNNKDGEVVWKSDELYPYPLIETVGNDIIIGYRGGIVKLSLSNGNELAHIKASRPEYVSVPIVIKEKVFVSCTDGFVYALNLR
ncbi:MAG: PQQ-binding-like beta-propeller repeat protein [Desulfosporosinus sp.]|nr:PQQ-binding-like beta-propeller repeat protein [Desulfosporosinus sp.]